MNFVWNFCNDSQRFAILHCKRWPTGFDLSGLCKGTSKLLGLHSQTVQAVCERYAKNRQTFKKRSLRVRGKRDCGWVPFKASGIKVVGDSICYQGRTFHFWMSREIEGVIKTGSFQQDARGRWYVSLQCEVPEKNPEPARIGGSVGVDLGLKTLATLSDGREYKVRQHFRLLEEKLAYAQRNNKKRMVQTTHAKIKNSRKDYNHKISHELTRDYDSIFIGDVGGSRMMRTRFAKSASDAAWSQLRSFVDYKAIARGRLYVLVNEAGTTVTCSCCGAQTGPRGRAGLGIREWTCSECGSHHNRDVNSGQNILRLGHQSLLSAGIPFL